MVQEEHQHQKYSNNSSGCSGGCSGGGRSSKKLKQKKIPQRGLGVAQLEKIRLEEQQKKDATTGVSSPSFVIPVPHSHHHQSSSSSHFPASPIDLSSTTPLFRNPPPVPISTLDLLVPPPPPSFPTTTTIYGSHQVASCGSSIWNNEMNYNGEIPRLDHGLACRTQLQNEAAYPIWHSPPPVVIDRKQPHSSTMGNVPSLISSSSGLGFPMELPSNQSFYSSHYYTPPSPWPEEEKVVGIKRPWPFSLDNLPKLPSIIKPFYRPEESSLCGNSNGNGSSTFKLEPADCIISEDSTSSTLHANRTGITSELKHNNGIKENGTLDGDFLTLGSSATSSSLMGCGSKKHQPLASIPSHYPIPEFDLHSSLVSIEEPLLQQPIHNFFPPKGQLNGVTATMNDQRRIESGDRVDLNLKL
ncbi:hypothetical protein NE237_031931 [Protea cynaroides]|uniref:Uncharacterized protein n=1 Tax=Protea cynaroides TaxID=273540 RepID=A0A9Q0L2D1_9MAGN|nr:hypothetical protein NE237_031931 [Protea cynaroides]